jgi:hypothetical protein
MPATSAGMTGAWPPACYFSQIFSGTDAVGQFIVPE